MIKVKNQLKTKLKDYKQRLENVAALEEKRSKVRVVVSYFRNLPQVLIRIFSSELARTLDTIGKCQRSSEC